MAWQITWNGRVWTEQDLTIGHVAAIVQSQGADSWEQIDPFAGPLRLLGILGVLVAADNEHTVEETIRAIALRPAVDLLNALSVVEEKPEVPQPLAA